MKKAVILMVLGGLAVGLGLGVTIPAAQAGDGEWGCFVVDRLPDTSEAADWKGAKNTATGLNVIATNSPAGTVLTVNHPVSGGGWGTTQTSVGMICVKQ